MGEKKAKLESKHKNCYAYMQHHCTALKRLYCERDYYEHCPFFKTEWQIDNKTRELSNKMKAEILDQKGENDG